MDVAILVAIKNSKNQDELDDLIATKLQICFSDRREG
jgi:hypothetical protein